MNQMIACCGIDCAQCEAYLATQADDLATKERVLAEWRIRYNSPRMDLAWVTCDGCTSTGRRSAHCGICHIRACAVEHGVANCAHCPDYSCAKLDAFLASIPVARANLEEILRLA